MVNLICDLIVGTCQPKKTSLQWAFDDEMLCVWWMQGKTLVVGKDFSEQIKRLFMTIIMNIRESGFPCSSFVMQD